MQGNERRVMDYKYLVPDGRHEEIAEKLSHGYVLESAIIVRKDLASDLNDNPKYATVKAHIRVCEVEEEARKEMQNRYMSCDEVITLLELWENDFKASNSSTEEEDRKLKSKMEDYFFEAQTKTLYPEIIEAHKYAFKTNYNEDTEEETEKTDEEFEKTWPIELQRILTPKIERTWERIYTMPEPHSHWDSRNVWQQTFVIRPVIDKQAYYCHGGSASSHQRFVQGLMAHTYAMLEHKYALKIPTTIYEYNECNEFVKVNKFDTFKTMDSELSGNYQYDWNEYSGHFKDRLLKMDYDNRTLKEGKCWYEKASNG